MPPSCSLQALRCSGIDAIIDETNLNALVSDTSGWVQANFQPYLGNVMFKYSTVGNEVEGGDTQKILPAMQNHNTARSLRQASAASRSHRQVLGEQRFTAAGQRLPLAYKDANGQIDLNYALFKVGASNVLIVVVSESEWPLDGGSVKGIGVRSLKRRRG
ncbi:glucan endo-1,3-beta-glucosidase GII-like [Panicum hallii]|uniref:glucan endo-1,3-beta-glucosidase GII-like n=1 Tax=Panicum hallii TaxID=206008 RepID=UPI000DF4CBA8|nr:glucan endo-1,3-beta-glucosidase GII-like [Panicum hallii]